MEVVHKRIGLKQTKKPPPPPKRERKLKKKKKKSIGFSEMRLLGPVAKCC